MAEKMDKDTQQKVVLGVIVIVAAVYGFFNFIVFPQQDKIESLRQKVGEIDKQIETQDRLILNKKSVQVYCNEQYVVAEKLAESYFPSTLDPLSWFLSLKHEVQSELEISTEKLNPSSGGVDYYSSNKKERDKSDIFEDYLAKLSVKGDYHTIGRVLAKVEAKIPVTHLKSLSISVFDEKSKELEANMTFAFPRPYETKMKEFTKFLESKEEGEK